MRAFQKENVHKRGVARNTEYNLQIKPNTQYYLVDGVNHCTAE